MAFIKLIPRQDRDNLPVDQVIGRLQGEFNIVNVDSDEGQNHVAGMIAAVLRVSDDVPGKQTQLAWLQTVQETAVYVSFGDDSLGPAASCCVMSDSDLFFDSPDEIHGDARPLVERAASVLDYTVYEG